MPRANGRHLVTARALAIALFVGLALVTVGVGMITRDGGGIGVVNANDRVDCTTLRAALPSEVQEYSSMLDREEGTVTIEFYGVTDSVVTVSYTDPVCLADPIIGPIVARHLEDARVDQLTECADLAERVASGSVVIRGRELNIDKVRAYMEQWC